MHRMILNNTLFCGTLAMPSLRDYGAVFRWAEVGIRDDAFGDTIRKRNGRYSVFAFQGRMTYLTMLGFDLGFDPPLTAGLFPKHRGHLVLSTDLSGHLEDAMLAFSQMVMEAKSGCHPKIAQLPEDTRLLNEARTSAYDLAQFILPADAA